MVEKIVQIIFDLACTKFSLFPIDFIIWLILINIFLYVKSGLKFTLSFSHVGREVFKNTINSSVIAVISFLIITRS